MHRIVVVVVTSAIKFRCCRSRFNLTEESSIQNDTDLVIIMTARPSPKVSIAGTQITVK